MHTCAGAIVNLCILALPRSRGATEESPNLSCEGRIDHGLGVSAVS